MTEEQKHKEIIEEMKKHVEEVIKTTVNGKIDKIQKDFNEYVVSDTAWKAENEPYLKGLANVRDGTRLLVKLSIVVSTLGGAWLVFKQIIK